MKCKGSYYNYKYCSEDGEILLMNMRTQRCIKIHSDSSSDIVNMILDTKNYHEIDDSRVDKLIEQGFVVPEGYDEIKILEMKHNEVIFGNDTLSVEIMPTNDCNFRCTYCFEYPDKKYMSLESEKKVINFLKREIPKCKQFRLAWFGGEPLLCIEQVIRLSKIASDLCKENKVPMFGEISTNGYCLDIDTFRSLIKNRITEFQICIDGPKAKHNETRPHFEGEDSHDIILNNLIKIQKEVKSGCFVIAIRTNVTPEVLPYMDEHLEEMAKYFKDDLRFHVIFQCVRDWGGDRVDESQIVENEQAIYERLYRIAREKGLQSSEGLNFAPVVGYCCANRKNGYVIDCEANIYKCALAMSNEKYREINRIGYINKSGKKVLDEAKLAQWIVSKEPAKDSCRECVLYPFCMGGHCFYKKNIMESSSCNLYILSMVHEKLMALDKSNLLKVTNL